MRSLKFVILGRIEYKKQGKSVYTKTFIEDNEDKVKALQEIYEFTYKKEKK